MPHSAVWTAADGTLLTSTDHHYREGLAELSLGPGFFRSESRPARDLSVLLARHQSIHATGPLRWLDLMAGCGIRALRWGLEALGSPFCSDRDLDQRWGSRSAAADPDQCAGAAVFNPGQWRRCRPVFFNGRLFSAGGSILSTLMPSGLLGLLIQPALQALRFDGLLFLASTDGRSPTGHDRPGAIRSLGSAARAHPSSWEMALRQQIGLVARQAWMLGRGGAAAVQLQ